MLYFPFRIDSGKMKISTNRSWAAGMFYYKTYGINPEIYAAKFGGNNYFHVQNKDCEKLILKYYGK